MYHLPFDAAPTACHTWLETKAGAERLRFSFALLGIELAWKRPPFDPPTRAILKAHGTETAVLRENGRQIDVWICAADPDPVCIERRNEPGNQLVQNLVEQDLRGNSDVLVCKSYTLGRRTTWEKKPVMKRGSPNSMRRLLKKPV